MVTFIATVTVQFLVALFIRLGYHKYTDGTVYAINRFVILILVMAQVALTGLVYLPFILGFFLVDFLFYYTQRTMKEVELRDFIRQLMGFMPDKKEESL